MAAKGEGEEEDEEDGGVGEEELDGKEEEDRS